MFLNIIFCLKLNQKCLLKGKKNHKSKKRKKAVCVLYAYMCLELQVINGVASSMTDS